MGGQVSKRTAKTRSRISRITVQDTRVLDVTRGICRDGHGALMRGYVNEKGGSAGPSNAHGSNVDRRSLQPSNVTADQKWGRSKRSKYKTQINTDSLHRTLPIQEPEAIEGMDLKLSHTTLSKHKNLQLTSLLPALGPPQPL